MVVYGVVFITTRSMTVFSLGAITFAILAVALPELSAKYVAVAASVACFIVFAIQAS